jgi:uncharacterized membrane protein
MSDPTVPPPPPPYYTPPPAPAPAGGGTVSSNRTIMIVLSYLWLLALIPLLVEKDDREVQWHAKHGLVLTAAEFILWVGFWILHMMLIFTHILAPLGCVLAIIQFALWIGILVLHILCIVKGVNGQRLLVPGISQYADKF